MEPGAASAHQDATGGVDNIAARLGVCVHHVDGSQQQLLLQERTLPDLVLALVRLQPFQAVLIPGPVSQAFLQMCRDVHIKSLTPGQMHALLLSLDHMPWQMPASVHLVFMTAAMNGSSCCCIT